MRCLEILVLGPSWYLNPENPETRPKQKYAMQNDDYKEENTKPTCT